MNQSWSYCVDSHVLQIHDRPYNSELVTVTAPSKTTGVNAELPPAGETTTTIDGSGCLSGRIYGEYSEEAELLRRFRDNILIQTPEGQEIIRLYYQWSSVIVKAMENDEELKSKLKEIIDEVLLVIGEIE